jgi:hypothetical protein
MGDGDKLELPERSNGSADSAANPHITDIDSDLKNRATWAKKDRVVVKRRLHERRRRKTKPYAGAPNFIVPIIDDLSRDKTDQEISMLWNSQQLAICISVDGELGADVRSQIQTAFDTYLRYVIQIGPRLEHALDCKNARGFCVVKNTRTFVQDFGVCADIVVRDNASVIVPPGTKQIRKASRITDVYVYSQQEFLEEAQKPSSAIWNKDNVKKVQEAAEGGEATEVQNTELRSTFETTKHLIGVDTTGEEHPVVIYELWHFAKQWDVDTATRIFGEAYGKRIIVGRRCKSVFSPQLPGDPLAIIPWRERDRDESLSAAEFQADARAGKAPRASRTVRGEDRPWPYHQPRYENRSEYYYDSRGIGNLTMDDQLAASQTQNAKHTMLDYIQQPQYTGGGRNTQQMTHEPGSVLPEGVKPVEQPRLPPDFDFTSEQFRRNASRRIGVAGAYSGSGDLSNKKRVQKTATETVSDDNKADVVSSASVERFNMPWQDIFGEMWKDMRRIGKPLPMINRRGENKGNMGVELYEHKILLIPAGNAKTLNPDLQFRRVQGAVEWCMKLAEYGVGFDFEAMAKEGLGGWDPQRAESWIIPAGEKGPQGQTPVYQQLGELSLQGQQTQEALKGITEMTQELAKAIQEIAKLATANSEQIDQAHGEQG